MAFHIQHEFAFDILFKNTLEHIVRYKYRLGDAGPHTDPVVAIQDFQPTTYKHEVIANAVTLHLNINEKNVIDRLYNFDCNNYATLKVPYLNATINITGGVMYRAEKTEVSFDVQIGMNENYKSNDNDDDDKNGYPYDDNYRHDKYENDRFDNRRDRHGSRGRRDRDAYNLNSRRRDDYNYNNNRGRDGRRDQRGTYYNRGSRNRDRRNNNSRRYHQQNHRRNIIKEMDVEGELGDAVAVVLVTRKTRIGGPSQKLYCRTIVTKSTFSKANEKTFTQNNKKHPKVLQSRFG